MKYSLLKYGVLLVMLHTLAYNSFSQGLSSNYGNFTPCSGPVALYTFDFTATVNNSITQANISIQNSDNQCCSEPSNAGCLFFNVIVDPNAIGVVFQQTFTGFGPHEYNFSGNGCADLVYTLTNAQGCVNQQLLEDYTCPLPSPIASFTHDPMEINSFDNGVNFTNTSLGADNYLWIFGDGSPNETIENPYHEYEATDDFIELSFQITLVAYSAEGCVDTAINYINLVPALIYYVPNAFTPDGDDHNNLFKPVFSAGFSVDKYSFMIFNRWGEVIYETQDIAAGWDGTYKGLPSQEGVYTWKIQFMKSNNAFREMEVGHVTLLRGSGID